MTYTPRLPARAHQLEALERMRDRDAFALLMEMGTGKSKIVVDEFGAAATSGDLLIVAPAGSYRNWWRVSDDDPGEIQKHMDPAVFEKTRVEHWRSGGGKAYQKRLDEFLTDVSPDRPRCLVVNVEALSCVRGAREACEKFLRQPGRFSTMVVDESTTIKGHNSRRTKFCFHLSSLADRRRILTGLVAPRDPLDLWAQFFFLDWRILGSRSFYGFRSRYAVMRPMHFGGRIVRQVVGFRDVEELHGKIAPHSYRKTKEECLDLPPVIDVSRDVELTPEQRKIYKELAENATSMLRDGSHVTATAVIALILRLDQVLCGHVVDEEGNVHDVPETRIAAVLDVLDEHGGKAIVWTAYDRCVRKLRRALSDKYGEASVACFWGGNRGERWEEERRFKTDPECRFMVSTPGAGGMGNTWVGADLAINHSYTYDLEDWEQSRARNHRDGQTRAVTYVNLVARGTVDEKKLSTLSRKKTIAEVIQGDGAEAWFELAV